MDIQKPDHPRAREIKRGIYAGVVLLLVGGTSIAVSRLRPPGPTVDRSTIWTGEVKRGAMLRDVHALLHWFLRTFAGFPRRPILAWTELFSGRARADLSVDGTIELENLRDILFVGRPAHGQPETAVGLFKRVGDGSEAVPVNAKLGRASVNSVEVLQRLNAHKQLGFAPTHSFALSVGRHVDDFGERDLDQDGWREKGFSYR